MKRIIAILTLICVSLSACGAKADKQDYKALYEGEVAKTANQSFENNSLKLALAGYDEKYKDSVDLTQYTVLNTGEVAFNTFNNQAYLSGKVKFEQQDAIQNSTKLYLVSNISVSPTDSWVIRTNTSRTELSNANGVEGNIELYKIYDSVDSAFIYENFVSPFLVQNNLTAKSMQYLFIGGSKSGVEVTTKVNITTTDVTTSIKSVPVDKLYSEDELNKVKEERYKAEKAKLEESREQERILQEKLAEVSEQGESSSEPTGATEPTVESMETAPLQETVGSEIDTEAETTENESENSKIKENINSEYVDVQVPEYKTTTSEYIFRVGVIMSGENAIVYKFLYKNDDKVGSNKEILDGLISSMEVDSMKVSMEK